MWSIPPFIFLLKYRNHSIAVFGGQAEKERLTARGRETERETTSERERERERKSERQREREREREVIVMLPSNHILKFFDRVFSSSFL